MRQVSPVGHGPLAHAPQCCGPAETSKQPPPPSVCGPQQTWLPTQPEPPLQVQAPPTHCSPCRQLWPQAPQLLKLVLVSTQLEPQHDSVGAQGVVPQAQVGVPLLPRMQISLAPQRAPQLPQLAGSLPRLAQPVAQQVSPVEQMMPLHLQAPPLHDSGGAHAWPQAPQSLLLLRSSAQALEQQTSGKLQLPVPQGHVPVDEQLALVPLSQQTAVAPVQAGMLPHLQTPATHDSPGLQAWPQVPQWKGSCMRSTQPRPAQQLWPGPHAEPPAQRQAPPEQLSPLAPQTVPQPPQFLASTVVRTQPEPAQQV
jgi:hypothetical protein